MRIIFRTIPALFLVAFAAVAGASATDTTVDAQHAYTAADIQFMDGMIAHHAQALLMAGWASSHGASPSILTLTSRITNAQTDEIAGMQKWLRDRHQPVPEANPHGMTMKMDGMEHTMLMPGMLTGAQLKQLDEARGKDFDRLFLTFMIQHHQGAVTMVTSLFDTYGAAQDVSVFKLASDISAEIRFGVGFFPTRRPASQSIARPPASTRKTNPNAMSPTSTNAIFFNLKL